MSDPLPRQSSKRVNSKRDGLTLNPRGEKVYDFVRASVGHVLTLPSSHPRHVGYTDVLYFRAYEALANSDAVPFGLEETMMCDLLYFCLLKEAGQPDSVAPTEVPDVGKSIREARRSYYSDFDDSTRLWCILDGIVHKEFKNARLWKRRNSDAKRRHGREGQDECCREFWEHFRANEAKTTDAQVAHVRSAFGGRLATKGCLPNVEARIKQEFDKLCPVVHHNMARRPSQLTDMTIAEVICADSPMTSANNTRENFWSVGYTMDNAENKSSSKGFAQRTQIRAQMRSREPSRESQASSVMKVPGKKNKRHRLKESLYSKVDSVLVQLPESKPTISSQQAMIRGPITKFTSWDDYKTRQQVLERQAFDGDNHMLHVASAKPQRQVDAALLEHRAAVEWRAFKSFSRALPEKTEPCGGALSARSRVAHLPEIVKKRGSNDGSMSDRSHVRIPQATFRRPWSREERQAQLSPRRARGKDKCSSSAIECYAIICRSAGIHPQSASIRFLVHLPSTLSLRREGISDEDLLALISSLPQRGRIPLDLFDVGENPRLTDISVRTVLNTLVSGSIGPLQVLRLDHCPRISSESISLCNEQLLDSLSSLVLLDLSGIPIGLQEYLGLAHAIEKHSKLRDVRLADTSLGRLDKAHASRVIAVLLQSSKLEALDLAWNMFDVVAFESLGKAIVEHDRLASLDVANSGLSYNAVLNGSPLLVFLEYLSSDQSLTTLNISGNALNDGAGLVLEYACRRHPTMSRIDVSSNPLGLNGRRSLLRLLACEECPKLTELVTNDCFSSNKDDGFYAPFDIDPSGKYSMDLAQPIHRAVLRILLMRCAEGPHGIPLQKLMRNATYRNGAGSSQFNFKNIQLVDNLWKVPTAGELSFELSASDIVIGGENTLSADIAVHDLIEQMATRPRLILRGGSKTIAVLSKVKKATTEPEMDMLLHAISRDFVLTHEQVEGLCITKVRNCLCGANPAETFCTILPCIASLQQIREVSFCLRRLDGIQRIHTRAHRFLNLNLENPNGHYDLALSEPSQYAVAQRLLLLNRWESHVSKAAGRPDISQTGNGKNFRNAQLGGRHWSWSTEDWRLPTDETFSSDYATLRRPPASARAIADETFKRMLCHINVCRKEDGLDLLKSSIAPGTSEGENADNDYGISARTSTGLSSFGATGTSVSSVSSSRSAVSRSTTPARSRSQVLQPPAPEHFSDNHVISVLWALSSQVWLNCRQLRELLCVFRKQMSRCEALVIFVSRTIDWSLNANQCHSKLEEKTWQSLKERIGYVTCFPFFQPENYSDSLDLSVNEQKHVAHLMISLWHSEHPDNMRKPRIDWIGPRAVPEWDNFKSGVPQTWSSKDAIPNRGLFEASYSCSKEDTKLKVRRRLATSIGGYAALPDTEAELDTSVKFWTVLGLVPEDVHHFLYFMVCNFKSLGQAFKTIDANGDGEISLKEFVAGCQELGFRLPSSIAPKDASTPRTPKKSLNSHASEGSNKVGSSPVASPRQTTRGRWPGSLDDEAEKVTTNLTAVYRYLDPNKDGSVSFKEFMALEGMWRELRQAMWEFVEHLVALHGSLEAAWDSADMDGNGTLDSGEFEALARQWQFDGPVTQVFMWIDQDGCNSISKAEWLTLAKIEKPSW